MSDTGPRQHPTPRRGSALGVASICALGAAIATLACSTGEKSAADKAEFHYQLANTSFYEHNTLDAISELHKAIELAPDHKEAHHLLGFVYFGRQDYAEAVRSFERALEIDPRFFEARSNLGAVLLAQQQWGQAAEVLEPLLTERLYPTPHLLHNNLGWAYYHQGKLDKAEHHYKTAAFLKPKMCLAHNNLGRLYVDREELDKAVRAFDRAVARCPEYQEPYLHLARLYEAAGEQALADKSYRKCYSLGPETPLGDECRDALGGRGGAR